MVKGMKELLKKSRAKKIYFINLMTKFGETNGFQASDFLRTIEEYLGKNILNYVIVNKTKPTAMRFRPYSKERAEVVEPDLKNFRPSPMPIALNLLRRHDLIRHDPEKIAEIVRMLV